MVKYSDDRLDHLFAALSDRTRRRVLASLEEGSRPVTELASAHAMSLPGFMKHLRVLEDAGLLERTKEGRVVRCRLQPEPMKEAASWIAQYEKFWTDKLDSLARYLYQQKKSKP
jgi:DNA-binding transcriptional ArsR family regulator